MLIDQKMNNSNNLVKKRLGFLGFSLKNVLQLKKCAI